MIFIKKNIHPPKVIFSQVGHAHEGKVKWKIATKQVLLDYANDPTPFNDGKYLFNADYGSEKFRKKLLECQGPKCAYCEKPLHNGAIEHFRPKTAWQQTRGTAFTRPGYYWLAYHWGNMLISCTECNQSGQKGNYFPVTGVRGISPSDCSGENCTIINPAKVDPAIHITFNLSVPVGTIAGGRGDQNIEIFKLKDRADLKSSREDHLSLYEAQKLISNLPIGNGVTQQKKKNARAHLKKAQNSKYPFAGMIRENIRKGLI